MEYELKVASFDILYAFINYQKFIHERLRRCGNVFTRLEPLSFLRKTDIKISAHFLMFTLILPARKHILHCYSSTDFDLRCAEP